MVKMAPKLTFTAAATDTQEGINVARMREERAARMRQVLRQHGVPSILVTGVPNVRYLTGFEWSEFQPHLSYTLFFAEHDPVVFAHAGYYQQMPDQAPWIKHWRIGRAWLMGIGGGDASGAEAKLFASEVHQELAERGLAGEKVGVVSFDDLAKEALQGEGLSIVDGWPLMLEASKIKTRDEINCLKMAASICGVGYQKALELLRPGVVSAEVASAIVNALQQAGSERGYAGVRFGPMAFERGPRANRRLEHGDLGYIPLCGTSYMGYTACLYRTYIVGRQPNSKERGWYDQLRDRIDAVIDAIKPGGSTADAAQHFPPASKWGYKDEAEVLTVEFGHGIGLAGIGPAFVNYNWPVINRQWSLQYPQV
ncbi:MAG: M24 family metallopeptidase, partial [Dehalococcoidia bacterium]